MWPAVNELKESHHAVFIIIIMYKIWGIKQGREVN